MGYRANRTGRTMFGRPPGRLQSKQDKTRRTERTMFGRPPSKLQSKQDKDYVWQASG